MPLAFTLLVLFVFIIILIYLSGWFSGTETALTHLGSASVAAMRQSGEKNINYIVLLKRDMDRTLITILIGNNIVNILLSSVAALVANSIFESWGVAVVIFLITFLIIIFGEITPKHSAIIDSRDIANRNAKTIYYIMRMLGPLIDGFMFISRKIIVFRGGTLHSRSLLVSDDSIKYLATLGEEEGVIKSIEKEIIHKVFGFGDRKIRDVMVPMKNVFYLEKNYSVRQVSPIIKEHGFTRVPVINKQSHVVGIVYSKDLIGQASGRITSIMRRPHFVRADSDISDIFNAMKRKRIHMAIVKNGNGGGGEDGGADARGKNTEPGHHIGIVTLEDIIEEVVGEIHDEYFEVKYRNGKRAPEEMIEEQGIYNEDFYDGDDSDDSLEGVVGAKDLSGDGDRE